jgi:hypothetical protein
VWLCSHWANAAGRIWGIMVSDGLESECGG